VTCLLYYLMNDKEHHIIDYMQATKIIF